ncbi:hypothetical protein ACFQY4_18460 [Catellatospora bangladeshensis]|uniref:Uncharacterized protein n=1 Tax=Catellatospora bangladeshensis TaxID=310355 RepID=A0A8J3JJV3_9ACTN|nr:hypothetical protein [Catellatospora bangladeshensis]GIF82006.1 hypothetical protein Cba03nite_33550 [Catellatospora bangladeshensis]
MNDAAVVTEARETCGMRVCVVGFLVRDLDSGQELASTGCAWPVLWWTGVGRLPHEYSREDDLV